MQVKTLFLAIISFSFIISPLGIRPGHASVFNVGTAAELQQALDDAATNGQNDTIQLAAGNYNTADNGGNPFTYTGTQANGLVLLGAGTGQTILDGGDATQVLKIDDNTGSGIIEVQGLTIQKGWTDSDTGAGLNINAGMGSQLDLRVQNCEFIGNHNDIASGGGAFLQSINGSITLEKNLFRDNSTTMSGDGGGASLNVKDGDLNINANTFLGNKSVSGMGGGLLASFDSAQAILTNNIFYDNSTDQSGGGAAVFTDTGSVHFTHNTVLQNHADQNGGGVHLELSTIGASADLYNNIVYDNTTPGLGADVFSNSDTNALFKIFNNNFSQWSEQTPSIVNMGANLDVDPELIDPTGEDFLPAPGSPMVDQGADPAPSIPNLDAAGNPRVFGAAPDLGALETIAQLTLSVSELTFGPLRIGGSQTESFTINNPGSQMVEILGFGMIGSGNFVVDPNGGDQPCGTFTPTLGPGASCTMTVTFDFFAGTSSPQSATITITSDDPNTPTLTLTLTGTGENSSGGCALNGASSLGSSGLWALLLALGILLGNRLTARARPNRL